MATAEAIAEEARSEAQVAHAAELTALKADHATTIEKMRKEHYAKLKELGSSFRGKQDEASRVYVETKAEGAQAEAEEAHAAIIEKMRADNAEAIQDVQTSAAERVDAAQERAKVAEDERDDMHEYREDGVARMQIEIDTLRETHARELHDQGKTIARMKGRIRELEGQDPPIEDDLAVDPVPGENEEEDQ